MFVLSAPSILFGAVVHWQDWWFKTKCAEYKSQAWGNHFLRECVNYTYSGMEILLLVMISIVVGLLFWTALFTGIELGGLMIDRYIECVESEEEDDVDESSTESDKQ